VTVGQTTRFQIYTWDSGSDKFTRSQMTFSHSQIDSLSAGFLQGVSLPTASAAYAGFFHYSSTGGSAGTLSYCNGAAWFTVGAFGNVVALDGVSSNGSLATYSRSDHKHSISNGSIGVDQLAANSVTTTKIQDNSVTQAKLSTVSDGTGAAVGADQLRPNAVQSTKILDANVTESKLAASAVTEGKIAAGAVTQVKLASVSDVSGAAVGTAQIRPNAVDSTKILDGNVVESKIATGAVVESKIASGAVTTDKIGSLQVTNGKLADSSVTTGKILAGTIRNSNISTFVAGAGNEDTGIDGTTKLRDATVTNAKLASGIDAAKITTGTLSADRIGANAIDSTRLQDDAVVQGKLATNSVGNDEIQNNAVTQNKLSTVDDLTNGAAVGTAQLRNDAVTELKIANNAVTGDKISNNAVTNLKIVSVDAAKLTSGTIPDARLSGNIPIVSRTYMNALATAGAGPRIIFGSADPPASDSESIGTIYLKV